MWVPKLFFSAECVVATTKMCTKPILLCGHTRKTKCSYLRRMNKTMDSVVSDIIRTVLLLLQSGGWSYRPTGERSHELHGEELPEKRDVRVPHHCGERRQNERRDAVPPHRGGRRSHPFHRVPPLFYGHFRWGVKFEILFTSIGYGFCFNISFKNIVHSCWGEIKNASSTRILLRTDQSEALSILLKRGIP